MFWWDVTAEFQTNEKAYNRVLSASSRFSGIDPSARVAHTAAKLYDMGQAVKSK